MPNKKTYSDQAFIDAITTQSSSADVADVIGCNARVATIRLKLLVASGDIHGDIRRGRWVFWAR